MSKSSARKLLANPKMVKFLPWLWAVLCGVLFARHYSSTPLLGDAGAFAGIAQHIVNGSVLYSDVFENKGPGIFILNALFIRLSGNNYEAVHIMQFLHIVAACICIVRLFTIPAKPAFWGTVLLLPWFCMRFSEGYCFFTGNYTEEYACYYLLFAITLIFTGVGHAEKRLNLFAAGLLLTQVIFIKETFAPLALTVALWAVIIKKENRLNTAKWLVAGSMATLGFYALWLLKNGAMFGYLHYLQFAFGYAGGENAFATYPERLKQFYNDWKGIDVKLLWFAAGSVLVLADVRYLKQNKGLPLLMTLMTIVATLPLCFGKTAFGHYFLAMVFFGLLSGMGFIQWLADRAFDLNRWGKFGKWALYVSMLIAVVPISFSALRHFAGKANLAGSEKEEREQAITKLKNFKTIFMDPQDAGRFYFYTGKSSGLIHPCTYYVYYQTETAGVFAECNRKAFLTSFLKNPPQCVVTEKEYGYGIQYAGLSGYVNENYMLSDSIKGADGRVYYVKRWKTQQ